MSDFREFKYSVITLICALIINISIISALYWFFNIRRFPPIFERDILIITILILTALTLLITKFLIAHFDIPSKRKNTVTALVNSCLFLSLLFYSNIVSNFWAKTQEINNIEEIYTVKNSGVRIKNFKIVENPVIQRQVKLLKSSKKIIQIVFLYPFRSEKKNIYYALTFKKYLDFETDEKKTNFEFNRLLKQAENSLKQYDFQKIKNFEYITMMSYDYDDFLSATQTKVGNFVFLKPVKETVEKKAKDEISSSMIIIAIILLIHIIILSFITLKRDHTLYKYS